MTFLSTVFDTIDFDRGLVYRFFVEFSLFEHALKNVGFKSKNRNDSAQADWDKYANDIDGKCNLHENPELDEAVNYILNNPPMKQVIELDYITFRKCLSKSSVESANIAVYLRRVRNNLFHGGKFRYERPRDTLLINYSLLILEHWAENDDRIKNNLRMLL